MTAPAAPGPVVLALREQARADYTARPGNPVPPSGIAEVRHPMGFAAQREDAA